MLLAAPLHLAHGGLAASPVIWVLVLAAVSLLPFAALTLTSFVKFAVVLSIARSALGTQQLPPTPVITGLALILSLQVMAPVGQAALDAFQAHDRPVRGDEVAGVLAGTRAAAGPVRGFLVAHSDPADRRAFRDLARGLRPPAQAASIGDDDLLVAMPAFVVGELRDAFRMGFLVFLPFLVVDLVVSTILLALGMHMLSPTTVSLPFKLLLFVAVDGWHLLAEALLRGYLPR